MVDDFLSVEESKKIAERYPDISFDFSYFHMKASDTYKIFPTNKVLSGSDSYMIERICPAVPSTFEHKIKEVKKTIQVIENLSPEDKLRKEYENISDKAWLFSPEMFSPSDFLDYRICKELWIITSKRREITGWAYYNKRLIQYVTRKQAEVIELRPLVADDCLRNNIFEYVLICPAVTKGAYPELDTKELSGYYIKNMPPIVIRTTILKILEGKKVYDCLKVNFVSQNNIRKELNVFFLPELKTMMQKVSEELKNVNVTFPFEEYLVLADERYIILEEKIQPLFNAIECLNGAMKPTEPFTNGIKITSVNEFPEKINFDKNGAS